MPLRKTTKPLRVTSSLNKHKTSVWMDDPLVEEKAAMLSSGSTKCDLRRTLQPMVWRKHLEQLGWGKGRISENLHHFLSQGPWGPVKPVRYTCSHAPPPRLKLLTLGLVSC